MAADGIRYTGNTADTLTVDPGEGDHTVRVEGPAGAVDRVICDVLPEIQFGRVNTFKVAEAAAGNGGLRVTFATSSLEGAAHYTTDLEPESTLVIEGRDDSADRFTVALRPGSNVAVTDNTSGVTVADLAASGAVGRLLLQTLGGSDLVEVNVDGTGLIAVPITFDGGSGRDTLFLTGTSSAGPTSAVYSPGPANSQGRIEHVAGGATMTVDFENLEPVIDIVAGTLTVNGTGADNAITYTQGPNAGPIVVGQTGLVSVDAFETIEFANKTTLTIDGLAGNDRITLNDGDATNPVGLTGIMARGNDAAAGDELVVNDSTPGTAIVFTPTAADGGTVTGAQPVPVTFTTIEHLTINGQGGNDTLVVEGSALDEQFLYTPAATPDAGSVRVSTPTGPLVPMSFLNLGADGVLILNAGGGSDQITVKGGGHGSPMVVVNGHAGDDRLIVDHSADTVAEAGALDRTTVTGLGMARRIEYQNIEAVDVLLGSGDDRFDSTTTLPATRVSVNGGDGNDTFHVATGNLNAVEGPVTIAGGDGAADRVFLLDDGNSLLADYLVTPSSVTTSLSPLAPPTQFERTFGGLTYDGSTELLRLEGTQAANVFNVQPSLATRYSMDGNLPGRGTLPADGDFLKLDTKTTFPLDPNDRDTSGQKLTITEPGKGSWEFRKTTHRPVDFESIERFNHVEIVAVGADVGSKSKPRVSVFDAETGEWKFDITPSQTYGNTYRQGVRVATGDVDNDGLPDIVVVPGRLRAPDVKIFSGAPMAGAEGVEIAALRIPAASTYGKNFRDGRRRGGRRTERHCSRAQPRARAGEGLREPRPHRRAVRPLP